MSLSASKSENEKLTSSLRENKTLEHSDLHITKGEVRALLSFQNLQCTGSSGKYRCSRAPLSHAN